MKFLGTSGVTNSGKLGRVLKFHRAGANNARSAAATFFRSRRVRKATVGWTSDLLKKGLNLIGV